MNNGVYGDIRLLNEESISEMHSIQYPRENGYQYGLGFQIWEKPTDTYIGHTGGLYGVATKMVFRSSDNIGIIFKDNHCGDVRDCKKPRANRFYCASSC